MSYNEALRQKQQKQNRMTFEIVVSDGLEAAELLESYNVDCLCDDNTVWVNVKDADKALELVKYVSQE